MSASATDIITYIGIPLAVLGVLPILYTFALSILTQRRIRLLLISHGHKPASGRNGNDGFVLRASPMTSLIEVEMPRYTIAPLIRNDERYWTTNEEVEKKETEDRRALLHGHSRNAREDEEQHVGRAETTLEMIQEGRVRGFLRGGSWRTFHWKRLMVGRKLYRIQYEDELREPPAEIDFADLVNFLLDWGAELDGVGWEKLRSGGLWTPAGTVLLRASANGGTDVEDVKSEQTGAWVLRTSMPDDSDGILTLCCRWAEGHQSGSTRDAMSLPPGWGRLRRPASHTADDNKDSLDAMIQPLVEEHKHFLDTTSLRFKLDSGLISTVYLEKNNTETGHIADLFRISKYTSGQQWFTATASALLTLSKSNGQLWGYETPNEILSFMRKDSIPCGVLVLLGLLNPDVAPHWDNSGSDIENERTAAMAHMNRFQARLQAERLEASMPPEQARVHKTNRLASERQEQMNEVTRNMEAKRAREQRQLQDAIASPRMNCKAVAELCLAWLIETKVVLEESTIQDVAEAVLFMLVLQSQNVEGKDTVIPVLLLLEEWTSWTVASGMKKEQFEMVQQHRKSFCHAACLVATVGEAALLTTGKGKASVDMLECLRLWKKVRLG